MLAKGPVFVGGPWLTAGMLPIQPQRHTSSSHSSTSRSTSSSRRGGVPRVSSVVSGPWPIALDSVVTRLRASEQRMRAEQAAQVTLFAEAVDQASPDHFATLRAGRLVHDHAQAELTYRTIRAELACALGLSEQTVERRMSHAYELTTSYPDTHLALRLGEISLTHTEVITTAGRIIPADDSVVSVSRRTAYEAAVLVHARRETPGRLRPIARRLAEQYTDHTIDERYAVAREHRRVWVTDHDDGMSDLTAYLPSVEAHAIYDRLTRTSTQIIKREARVVAVAAVPAAHAAADAHTGTDSATDTGGGTDTGSSISPQSSTDAEHTSDANADTEVETVADPETRTAAPHDLRTRDQVRADLFSQLLRAQGESLLDPANADNPTSTTGGSDIAGGVQAHVQIFVTDDTLFANTLNLDDDIANAATRADTTDTAPADWGAPTSLGPAELSGSGPIDTATARRLAADAPVWDLATLHPVTGAVLSVGRYRPSEQIRRMLRARDLHCRFPGCNAPTHRCDLDHTIDAATGGATSTTNLAHLCRGHHVLKHHGGWQVTQTSDGILHWRSPTGRAYTDRPPSRVRFERTPPNEPPSADRAAGRSQVDRASGESPPDASPPGIAPDDRQDEPFPF